MTDADRRRDGIIGMWYCESRTPRKGDERTIHISGHKWAMTHNLCARSAWSLPGTFRSEAMEGSALQLWGGGCSVVFTRAGARFHARMDFPAEIDYSRIAYVRCDSCELTISSAFRWHRKVKAGHILRKRAEFHRTTEVVTCHSSPLPMRHCRSQYQHAFWL